MTVKLGTKAKMMEKKRDVDKEVAGTIGGGGKGGGRRMGDDARASASRQVRAG